MLAAFQTATPLCASCGQPREGRFCSFCGEEELDFHSLTVRHFVSHALHELFELDGKIWRTLRALILRPGFLSAEYCSGRRKLYASPFRLLIISAIVYALSTRGGLQISLTAGPVALSLAPAAVGEGASIYETVQRIDRFHLLGAIAAEREAKLGPKAESEGERFHQRLEKFAEPLSFCNVLLLAAALQVFFHRRRRHFVEHGVFSMHFMSFALFTGLLFFPARGLLTAGWGAIVLPLIFAVLIWQFCYLVFAIKRFYYGEKLSGIRPKAFATGAAFMLYALNSVFITAAQTAGAAIALWLT